MSFSGPLATLQAISLYLDQFKRGFRWTAVYLLRDRVDEAGNQQFGFYRPDYTPRKAAVYLHNLTTILADPGRGTLKKPGTLAYAIPNPPPTVHDMLLQKSDGTFQFNADRLAQINGAPLSAGTHRLTVHRGVAQR